MNFYIIFLSIVYIVVLMMNLTLKNSFDIVEMFSIFMDFRVFAAQPTWIPNS